MRRFFEQLIKGILFLSSTVTTLTVMLIIVYLFREGWDLFQESPLEGDNVILVHHDNPVQELSAATLKRVYDQEITNWKSLGGKQDSILLFSFQYMEDFLSMDEVGENFEFLPLRLDSLIETNPGMIAVISSKYVGTDFRGHEIKMAKVGLGSFLSGKEWFPTAHPAVQMGVLPIILGTIYVSILAILLALPIGLATAIYLAEVADFRTRNFFKPLIELLAGIPSVVYGFFGLVIIVPFIQNLFGLDTGQTALTGSIVLAIMALPTIITVSEDSMRTVPISLKEASLGLGANRWQTILRVIVPYSSSGIAAATILGIGRAIGETMAVLMVTGNAAVIPHSLLQPVRTIPATIAAELGEAPVGGIHYKALFALGCILFILTMLINLWVEYIVRRRKRFLGN